MRTPSLFAAGWIVFLDGKAIRGPFMHKETADESAEQLRRGNPSLAKRFTVEFAKERNDKPTRLNAEKRDPT
jgi:hypothetical protein